MFASVVSAIIMVGINKWERVSRGLAYLLFPQHVKQRPILPTNQRPAFSTLATQSMKLNEPQDYKLNLNPGGAYELSTASGVVSFSSPASTRGVAKLYTLSHGGKLIYVGIAQQPMSSRLNYGFKADGKGGYHGYKWKHLSHQLSLSIWTASVGGDYVPLREMETIEAEVAFLCRKLSGQWPEFQHEIHFYASQSHHREAAERIYSHATAIHG
jgi:hypothetical protein